MNKENKLLIILIIIFLLLVGIYLIYKLFNDEVAKDNETNDIVYNNYELIMEIGKFKRYSIDIIDNTIITDIEGNTINYNSNSLSVNGVFIMSDITLLNDIAFYDKSILFMATNNDEINMFIVFNTITVQYVVIDKIDGMSIINLDNVVLFEAGIGFHVSYYYNNKLHIDNKEYDLCKYKSNPIISKNILYFYDYPVQEFNDIEVIETNRVKSFKKKYC